MYYDRSGTRTVKPNATGRMPLKILLRLKMGFYGMDGTFNVIKSSYYHQEEAFAFAKAMMGETTQD
jgi:hypothetical protein